MNSQVPDNYPMKCSKLENMTKMAGKFLRIKGVRWFTNLDHGRRHQPLPFNDNGRQFKVQQT